MEHYFPFLTQQFQYHVFISPKNGQLFGKIPKSEKMNQQNSTIYPLRMPEILCKNSRFYGFIIHKIKASVIFLIFSLFLFSSREIFAQNSLKREVRAAWIATVKNIDWPSRSGLTVSDQKAEADRILDSLQAIHINTVYLQVRSSADALYAKGKEPWAEWLNGKQGLAPVPFYDPLEYFINGAHDRGMELHAWINPYRAVFNNQTSSIVPYSIIYQHPDWFFKYENRTLFNPGIPAVREYIESIIMDIAFRYDIDGIHMDDYFYPYPVPGFPIPDSKTFAQYGTGFSSINEWRRNNINLLIREIHEKIKACKSYIKFGVSPFGVWRNLSQDSLGSDTHGGASFDHQYADSRGWIKNGWVDYLIPQIYFSIEFEKLPFQKAIRWWDRNTFSRQVYIGLGVYRIGEKNYHWTDPDQLPRQIYECRKLSHISGLALYSAKSILSNKLGVRDSLKSHIFPQLALPPVMNWLDSVPPGAPEALVLDTVNKGIRLRWTAPDKGKAEDSTLYYLVYRFNEGEELNTDYADHILGIIYNKTEFVDKRILPRHKYIYLISATDRLWNESKTSEPMIFISPGI